MIRSGNSLRFTGPEVEEFRSVGLALDEVKTPTDFADVLDPWIEALGEVRPDLLERLVQDLAKAKGAKLPPRLSVVPSCRFPD